MARDNRDALNRYLDDLARGAARIRRRPRPRPARHRPLVPRSRRRADAGPGLPDPIGARPHEPHLRSDRNRSASRLPARPAGTSYGAGHRPWHARRGVCHAGHQAWLPRRCSCSPSVWPTSPSVRSAPIPIRPRIDPRGGWPRAATTTTTSPCSAATRPTPARCRVRDRIPIGPSWNAGRSPRTVSCTAPRRWWTASSTSAVLIGNVYALDAASGEQRWAFATGA